jgi:hypothetical protein
MMRGYGVAAPQCPTFWNPDSKQELTYGTIMKFQMI